MQKGTLLYFFLIFVIICLQETQIWKHRVIGIENHTKLQMIYYIHTYNYETGDFMSRRKKLKERNMMGKMKNELMIQKKCVVCKKWHLTIQRIIMVKKMAIMKMTIVN